MLQRRRLERRHLVCIVAEGGVEHGWTVDGGKELLGPF